jgi:hypothetical protein
LEDALSLEQYRSEFKGRPRALTASSSGSSSYPVAEQEKDYGKLTSAVSEGTYASLALRLSSSAPASPQRPLKKDRSTHIDNSLADAAGIQRSVEPVPLMGSSFAGLTTIRNFFSGVLSMFSTPGAQPQEKPPARQSVQPISRPAVS